MTNEEFQKLVLEQLGSINKRLNSIDEGQERLESKVGSLEEGQIRLESKVGSLEEGQIRLESKVGSLEEGQIRLESKVDKLEIRIENEVIEKIRGLYDYREVTNDKFDQVIDKLSDIDDSINYALAKIARHEIKLLSKKKLP
ncbi:hypothetical protein N752_25070 [Desulforamulus aquiferis]|nr:hypothetical protein [Desulforamulus aquiferis]RYD02602.1 hypothetical protein N752_25070 [Desulforamulus aquiferis]